MGQFLFLISKKFKYDLSKERGKGRCWIITIMSNQLLHDQFMLCECRYFPSSRSPSTGSPRTVVTMLLRLFEFPSSTWQQVGVAERIEHNTYPPRRFPPLGPPYLLTTLETIRVWRFPFRNRDLILYCQTVFLNFVGFQIHEKSGKKYHKEENFPGHFHGLDQLLFGIGN